MAAPIALGFYFLYLGENVPIVKAGYVFVSVFSVFWIVNGFRASDRLAKEQGVLLRGKRKYVCFHVVRFGLYSIVPLVFVFTYSALLIGSSLDFVQLGAFVFVGLGVIYGALLIKNIFECS